MPTTPRGIVYPASSEHTRLWEHLQATADSADAALDLIAPRAVAVDIGADSANATTTATDVADMTVDVDTTGTGFLLITATWDLVVTAFTSATAVSGFVVVDGGALPGNPVWTITANSQRNTITRSYLAVVGPGTHTVKGQFRISAATLSVNCRALDTGLTVLAVG